MYNWMKKHYINIEYFFEKVSRQFRSFLFNVQSTLQSLFNPIQVTLVGSNVWELSNFFFTVINVFLLSALDFGVSFIEAFNIQ